MVSKRIAHGALRLLVIVPLALQACGAALSQEEVTRLRHELRDAMRRPVHDRNERDENSRTLADVVGHDALHGMNRDEVQAAFGPGQACRAALCAEHGFDDGDFYYEIGQVEGGAVKQLPVLIVGFDPMGRAARIWTLTTH